MNRNHRPGRVVFTNNYPIDEAHRLWREGRFPDSHLFGGSRVEEAGFDVNYVGPGPERARTRLGARLRHDLGMRVPQRAALASGVHSAFAAEPTTLAGLALLRGLGLWRRPVVALVHPGLPPGGGLLRRALLGYDVVITMSALIHRALVEDLGRDPSRTLWAPCGPDLSWAGYQPRGGAEIISSGKTHRDETTLLQALRARGLPARVHTQHIEGDVREGPVLRRGRAPYSEVLNDLCRAGVVAIPLSRSDGTFGLTELNDALALGKPVIMTRNAFLDVDVEAIGCGRVVDPGDVGGWVDALRELEAPALRAEKGARGRAFAETSWNSRLLGDVVVQALQLVS